MTKYKEIFFFRTFKLFYSHPEFFYHAFLTRVCEGEKKFSSCVVTAASISELITICRKKLRVLYLF